jgi:hypothetical protein
MNGHVHGVAGPHDSEGGRVRKSLQVCRVSFSSWGMKRDVDQIDKLIDQA